MEVRKLLTPKRENNQKWHEVTFNDLLWNQEELEALYKRLKKANEISKDITDCGSPEDDSSDYLIESGEPKLESLEEEYEKIIRSYRKSSSGSTPFSSSLMKQILLFIRMLTGTYQFKPKAQVKRKKTEKKKKKKEEILPIVKMGIKTGLSLLFNLMKRSTSDGALAGLCEDLLMSAHEMIFEFPPLTLYDTTGENVLTEDSLSKVNAFLSVCSDTNSKFSINEKYLALILQLDLAYQSGSLSSILGTVVSFVRYPDPNARMKKEYYSPLVSLLKKSLDEMYAPKEGEESTYVADKYLEELTAESIAAPEEFSVQKIGILLLGYIKEFSKMHTPSGGSSKSSISVGVPRVFMCGSNSYSQCVGISGFSPQECNAINEKQPKMALAGSDFTTILSDENILYSVGKGDYGRLGTGNSNSVSTLTNVAIPVPIQTFSISQNSYGHGLAIDENGDVWSWGDGDYGKLGHGNSDHCHTPKLIVALQGKGVVDICCGWKHSACVTEEGKVMTWGLGDYGRLASGDSNSRNTPTEVAGLENVAKVYCGDSHMCCLTKDRKVYIWGENSYGKLGLGGGNESKYSPVELEALGDKNIIHLSCGEQHTVALSADGTVYTWGMGSACGQPGETNVPTLLACDSRAVFATAGYKCTFVITDTGSVMSVGESDSGQSGFNSTNSELTVISELDGVGITHIASGSGHTVFSTLPNGLQSSKNLVRAVSRAPYCIDLSKTAFDALKHSLSLFEDASLKENHTLSDNEIEYFTTAVLSLLRVNLYHVEATRTDPEEVGFAEKSPLLQFYRETLLHQLQHGSGSVRDISKTIFQESWTLLLPSINERLEMLDSLIPQTPEEIAKPNFLADLLITTLLKNQDYPKTLGLLAPEADLFGDDEENNFTEALQQKFLQTMEKLFFVAKHTTVQNMESGATDSSSYAELLGFLHKYFLAKVVNEKVYFSETLITYCNQFFSAFKPILEVIDAKVNDENFDSVVNALSSTSTFHTMYMTIVFSLTFMEIPIAKSLTPMLRDVFLLLESINAKNPKLKVLENIELAKAQNPDVPRSWILDAGRLSAHVLSKISRSIAVGPSPTEKEETAKEWFENTIFCNGLKKIVLDSENDKFLFCLLEENPVSSRLFGRLQSRAVDKWIMIPRAEVELPPVAKFLKSYFVALIKHHGFVGITKKYAEDESENPELPKSLNPLFEILYSTREKIFNRFSSQFPEIVDSDEPDDVLIPKKITAFEQILEPLIKRTMFLIEEVSPSVAKEESSHRSLFSVVGAVKKASFGNILRQSVPVNSAAVNDDVKGGDVLHKSVADASEFKSILWKPMSTVINTLRRLRSLRTESSPTQIKDLKAKIEGFVLSESLDVENLCLALAARQERASHRVEGLKGIISLISNSKLLDSSKVQAIRAGFELTFNETTVGNYTEDIKGVSLDVVTQIEEAAHELYTHIITLFNTEVEEYQKITGGEEEVYLVTIIINLLKSLTLHLNPSDISVLIKGKLIVGLLPLLKDSPENDSERELFRASKGLFKCILATFGSKSTEVDGTALTAIQSVILDLLSHYNVNKSPELAPLLSYLRRICVTPHIRSCLASPECTETLFNIARSTQIKEAILATRLLSIILPAIDFNKEGNARLESSVSTTMEILSNNLKVAVEANRDLRKSETTLKTETLNFEFNNARNAKCSVANKTQISQNANASLEDAGYCLGKEVLMDENATYSWKVFASDERDAAKMGFFGVAKSSVEGALNVLESSDVWVYCMENGCLYNGGIKGDPLQSSTPNLSFLEFILNKELGTLHIVIDESKAKDGAPVFENITGDLVPICGFYGAEERITINIIEFTKTSKVVSAFEPRVPLTQSIIAQEAVELLRSLHKKEWWSNIINQGITTAIRELGSAFKELSSNIIIPDQNLYLKTLSHLKIIAGVDEGIRLGGQISDEILGVGTIHEFKLSDDKALVQYIDDGSRSWVKMADLITSTAEVFNCDKLYLGVPELREFYTAITPIQADMSVEAQNLHLTALKVLSIFISNKKLRLAFNDCDQNLDLFNSLLKLAVQCIPLKNLFCITELERASISLASLEPQDSVEDDEFINEKFIVNADFVEAQLDSSVSEWLESLKDKEDFKAVRFSQDESDECTLNGSLEPKVSRKIYNVFMNDLSLKCKDKRKALLLVNKSLQILYARKAIVTYLNDTEINILPKVEKDTTSVLRLIKLVTSGRVMQLKFTELSSFVKNLIALPPIAQIQTSEVVNGILAASKNKPASDSSSDLDAVSAPPFVSSQFLLECILKNQSASVEDEAALLNSLSAAILSPNLTGSQKNWAVKLLIQSVLKGLKQKKEISELLSSPCSSMMISKLPQILLPQYKSEKPQIQSGSKLLYSQFTQFMSAIAVLARLPITQEGKDWIWLQKYASVLETMRAVNNRLPFPMSFVKSTFKNIPENLDFIDNERFTTKMDADLLDWKKTIPSDWKQPLDIFIFGKGEDGQLAEQAGYNQTPVSAPESFTLNIPADIVLGERCSFILTDDGNVFATGLGDYGRLGLGSNDTRRTFEKIAGINNVKVLKASRGSYGHSLALDNNGALWSWGDGDYGKLGHGDRNQQPSPKIIQYFSNAAIEIKDFACGYKHSMAISSTGDLYTWGLGDYGRLGHGDSNTLDSPKLVEVLSGSHPVDYVSGGSGHTIAITDDFTQVWSWGDGDNGKLGHGDTTAHYDPVLIPDIDQYGPWVKAETGEEFSALLSQDGKVYMFGTANNGICGQGSADSSYSPVLVSALEDKKIVDIQAGGYHMLALTDTGDVYSWGGGEYGQTGHGHSNSEYTPTLVEALSGRHISKITCGSGHSCCWSIIKDESKLLPEKVHDKYASLKDVFNIGLVHRIRLLNNISNEVFGSLSLIPIQPGNEKLNFGFSKIKSMLKFEEKIRVLRSTLSSSSTSGDYGPTLQLNRWLAEKNKTKSIFFQVGSQLADLDGKSLRYERRVYKVEFFGEGSIDAGGPYNESISQISIELMNERTPVLEKTANGKAKVGYNQDCLVPTTRSSPQDMALFKFLGRFLGFAIRTKSPIAVKIAKPVWKKLLGLPITPSDIKEIDENFVKSHECLLKVEEDGVTEETFEYLPLEMFPPVTYQGNVIEISWSTRVQYVNAAYALKYHQWDKQIEQIKVGLNEIVPIQLLCLFSPEEVETLVCGSAEFNWELLKQNTKYSGDFSANHDTIKYFWEVLESLTPQESELFLRFVWGKTRLPNSSSEFSHTMEVQSLSGRVDAFPTSATCFFKLNLPCYQSKDVLKEKLLYAIENCTRIDTDNNAGNIEEYEEEDAQW